jgi:hypothetical protein
MTQKKKAKELVGKYSELVPDDFGGMDDELAKKCALIAVDEILKDTINIYYWHEVKTEIELL